MTTADVWSRVDLKIGDITKEPVDAIVNAANSRLAGGGGVDGAIHRAAGAAQLQAACRALGGCSAGDAKLTPGFNLPARCVIHAVGPVYRDGQHGEPRLLASCYRRSLQIAVDHGLKTIAFPAISTGVYGFPFEPATEIALGTTREFLGHNQTIERAVFIFFGPADFDAARAIAERMSAG